MRHQNKHSNRIKWVCIVCSKKQPYNKHFFKSSYFVSLLKIAGSNNIAIDSSTDGSPSDEVFLTNSQSSTLFSLSSVSIRPWNAESLESTDNSPLALVQGVARATVQMNRRMREREQRELEQEELQRDQERREREIRMRRNREMIERERREIRRSRGWRDRQEAVPGPWCSCRLDEVTI